MASLHRLFCFLVWELSLVSAKLKKLKIVEVRIDGEFKVECVERLLE